MTPAHLYLHVPFCARRCCYCDFAVTATPAAPVDAWLDAIAAELALHARAAGWPLPLRPATVYCGGGTPSLLGPDAMARLRQRLEPLATWDAGAEWTCEANPESFTAELAQGWAEAGVNRISLGAQTFHEPALRWMGRLHGPDGPARAIAAARGAGLDNVSLDLIFGLPARLGRDWSRDLGRALALEPAHISLYGLTAESATPLGRWVAEGRERMADEDAYAAEYLAAATRLVAAGYDHYEVSNFARPGRASRHNRAYWDGSAYLGLGPGAHSFLPPRRSWNVRDWADYRRRIEERVSAVEGGEEVTGEAALLERIWLGLRQEQGLRAVDLNEAGRRRAAGWAARGWAEVDGAVRLTAEGWLLLDRLAVELADDAPSAAGPGAVAADVIAAASLTRPALPGEDYGFSPQSRQDA
ncbi:MAG TPA: radical SAM family heme chaperone HemW [Longimicrobiales bacterium]|nr:radical SAM family heme chaperone HemW [Longimicrobiales bacterium]